MRAGTMKRTVNRRRYGTDAATLVASDAYWDGHNFERHGRNSWLYRTGLGAYFVVTRSQWQGEQDSLEPVSVERATELYEHTLSEHAVEYEVAFPEVEVVDA